MKLTAALFVVFVLLISLPDSWARGQAAPVTAPGIQPQKVTILTNGGKEAQAQTTRVLAMAPNRSLMTALAALQIANLPTQAKERISWGKTFRGLQGGLAFQGSAAQFRVGETVKLNLYWRNVTKEPITISYVVFPDFAFYPSIRTKSGHNVPLHAEPILGLEETRTLAPGQTRCVAHPVMVIAPRTVAEGSELLPAYHLLPGRYVVNVSGNEKDSSVPISGSLEFRVLEK